MTADYRHLKVGWIIPGAGYEVIAPVGAEEKRRTGDHKRVLVQNEEDGVIVARVSGATNLLVRVRAEDVVYQLPDVQPVQTFPPVTGR